MFCGVRSAEFRKEVNEGGELKTYFLRWRDVDLEKQVLTIPSELAKKGKIRKIHFSNEVKSWLLRWFKDGIFPAKTKSLVPELHAEKYSRVRKLLTVELKPNVLRHTYASYRVALVGASKAATELGNSAGVVLEYYAEAVDEQEANEFFNLSPEKVLSEKVVEMKKSG